MHSIDFHMHSELSPDGSLNERDFKRLFDAGLLDTVAVTDHDQIAGAIKLHALFGDRIIVGEEITTSDGEIIGLYLTKRVSPGKTALQTAQAIHKQGGLVYIPHPFEKVRKGLSLETLNLIASHVDIIEVINGRAFSTKARKSAVAWAAEHNVVQAAASDAHGRRGWGRVYTRLPQEPTRDTLIELMKSSELHGSRNGIISYTYPKLNRLRKRVGR